MTANHSPGCPAIVDVRDGCACLLRQTSSTGPASSYPPPRVLPTSRGPGEEREYGTPHDDPCDCDDCREAVAAQGEHDPRIVHVASELVVDLGPQAENEGNVEYITDVIAAVDYANEQCGLTYEQGRADERHRLICGEDVMPSDCACLAEGYARGRADERERMAGPLDHLIGFAEGAQATAYAAGIAKGRADEREAARRAAAREAAKEARKGGQET